MSAMMPTATPLCAAGSPSSLREDTALIPHPVPVRDWSSLIEPVRAVITKKKANMQEALAETSVRYSPSMIGGDILTMAYTGFNGLQSFVPGLQTLSCIGWITSGAGEIGGLINIMVACQEIKEALTAQNYDRVTFWKNMLDAHLYILIGLLMIMIGISTKVVALGGLSAFFIGNPWLLPVLFFAASIPLICEVSHRVKNIVCKMDLAAHIDFQVVRTNLESNEKEKALDLITHIPLFWDLLHQCSSKEVSDKMEALQADMGVEAAIEIFSLFQQLIDNSIHAEQTLEQVTVVEQRLAEWQRAQYVRLFQQLLYILAFVISMGTFVPGVNANRMNGSDNMAMAAANLIPLYMDVCWPFKRNVKIVVKPVSYETPS